MSFDGFPAVLEVGNSETTADLFRDAEHWLNGTSGVTELVILINIKQKQPPCTLDPSSCSSWGLTQDQIQNIGNVTALSDHIVQWYRDQNIPLVEKCKAEVYFCSKANPRPGQPTWSCDLSPDDDEEPDGGTFVSLHEFLTEDPQLSLRGVRVPLPFNKNFQTTMRTFLRHEERKKAVQRARKMLVEFEKEVTLFPLSSPFAFLFKTTKKKIFLLGLATSLHIILAFLNLDRHLGN